jgi:hypothetical protein
MTIVAKWHNITKYVIKVEKIHAKSLEFHVVKWNFNDKNEANIVILKY